MNKSELAESAANLALATNAAVARLGLSPNTFDWFSGEVRYPMSPQRILTDSKTMVDYYTDNVAFYGGNITNDNGDFNFGHIQAHISEPIEGKHRSGHYTLPVPYIGRLLIVKDGIITVDTPSKDEPLDEGPVVVEGYNPRFRVTTLYNTATEQIQVKNGQFLIYPNGRIDDHTVAQDAASLPDYILAKRVATAIRAINITSSIFNKIASQDRQDVLVRVTNKSNRITPAAL